MLKQFEGKSLLELLDFLAVSAFYQKILMDSLVQGYTLDKSKDLATNFVTSQTFIYAKESFIKEYQEKHQYHALVENVASINNDLLYIKKNLRLRNSVISNIISGIIVFIFGPLVWGVYILGSDIKNLDTKAFINKILDSPTVEQPQKKN